jgi:hypothetical protein
VPCVGLPHRICDSPQYQPPDLVARPYVNEHEGTRHAVFPRGASFRNRTGRKTGQYGNLQRENPGTYMTTSPPCGSSQRAGARSHAGDLLPSLESWYSFAQLPPRSPLELLAYAAVLPTVGKLQLRTELLSPSGGLL